MGDCTKEVYETRKGAELLIERERLQVTPVIASLAIQRRRVQNLVDDWTKMPGGERKRMLSLIFKEIQAEHVDGKVIVRFMPLPHWKPYVEAVLARKEVAESISVCFNT